MSIVFLLEPPNASLNIECVKQYGTIKYIFGPTDRRCSVFDTEKYSSLIIERLYTLDFNPDVDFFCVCGSLVPLITAVAALISEWGRIRILFYRANESIYVERSLCYAE